MRVVGSDICTSFRLDKLDKDAKQRVGVQERHLEAEEAVTRGFVDQLGALHQETSELGGDVIDAVGDVMHARAALGEELSDRSVGVCRRQKLDRRALRQPQRDGSDSLVGDGRLVLHLGAEQPPIALDGGAQIVGRNAYVMDAGDHGERSYRGRDVPAASAAADPGYKPHENDHSTRGRNRMGLFDKVKDIAADAGDKAKDLGQQAQSKMELRKLEAALEEAYTAYGKRAYALSGSDGLRKEALAPEAAQVAEANAAVEVKKAEIANAGAHRLRHTLATDLLRAGASLPDIGQVLRHRSQLSTAIYAKVDHERLRELARPWPGTSHEVGAGQ